MTDFPAPRFSVVVPTRNRPELLSRAIRSVQAQSFDDFELLVVDDASSRPLGPLLREHQDRRLILLERSEPGGAAKARNTGLRVAKGELIAFLDDDDEFLPDFLRETHESFSGAGPEVGLSWCGVRWVEDVPGGETLLRNEIWQPTFSSREEAYLGFLHSRRVGTNCGLSLRKSVLGEVGLFDESLSGAEDTDYLIRLVRQVRFVVVPKVLIKIHLHRQGQLREKISKQAAAYERIVQKNLDTLARNPRLWAELHYKTGWLHYHAANSRIGRRYLLRALSRRPLHWKSWAALTLFETVGPRAARLHRSVSRWRGNSARISKGC